MEPRIRWSALPNLRGFLRLQLSQLVLVPFSTSTVGPYFLDTSYIFSPKDDNLGELMSTVCGCTCEGGQVWVHARRRGVGDRPDPAGGRLGVD